MRPLSHHPCKQALLSSGQGDMSHITPHKQALLFRPCQDWCCPAIVSGSAATATSSRSHWFVHDNRHPSSYDWYVHDNRHPSSKDWFVHNKPWHLSSYDWFVHDNKHPSRSHWFVHDNRHPSSCDWFVHDNSIPSRSYWFVHNKPWHPSSSDLFMTTSILPALVCSSQK